MRNLRPWTRAWSRELGWLIIRVTFGLSMATHGYAKLFGELGIAGFAERAVAPMGFPAPTLFAYLAALSEFVGGLCIALGLLTPLAAVTTALTMAVATFRHMSAGDPFGRYELAVVYLAISLAAILLGGGRYALDSRLPFFRSER